MPRCVARVLAKVPIQDTAADLPNDDSADVPDATWLQPCAVLDNHQTCLGNEWRYLTKLLLAVPASNQEAFGLLMLGVADAEFSATDDDDIYGFYASAEVP